MQHDWQYAYCLAVGQPYAGMTIRVAYESERFRLLFLEWESPDEPETA